MNILRILVLAVLLGPLAVHQTLAQAPTAGLIHQWHLDEGKGTTAFDSIGTWDFTLSSGVTHTPSGIKGPSIQLFGSDFFSTGIVATTSLNDTFTVSFWTLLTGLSAYPEGIVALGGLKLDVNPNGAPSFSSNGFLGDSYISINDQRWHLLSIVVNGGVESLYVDADKVAITKFTASKTNGIVQFGLTNQNYLYKGLIDEVSIYNRALSPAEIAQAAAVPEPSAALLIMGALGAFLPCRRRARRSCGARRE